MKKSNELLQLKKVQMNHNQTTLNSEFLLNFERTTRNGYTQFRRSFDFTSQGRTSTSSKGDISINLNLKRSNSFVTFESTDSSLSISQIKNIKDPTKYTGLTELQLKIWRSISKCSNQQLESVYIIDILVINQGQEYEFKFDISNLSCLMTVTELCEQIHQIFYEQWNQKLQNPQLHILIGIIKTQRLDKEIRLFELFNLLINGKKTLILQQSIHNL